MSNRRSRSSKREPVSSLSSLKQGYPPHSFGVADSESDDDYRKRYTDEDIAVYMAKKAQKKLAKVDKILMKLHRHANDSNLNERFVWKKKIRRDIAQGVPIENFSLEAEKKRKRERFLEIRKLKKRREQSAVEKAQREEEIALLGRARSQAEVQDWEKKEAEFLFEQSKIRSEIRLREGRVKPIDMLANLLHPSNDLDDFIGRNEPYMVLKGLTVKAMEELHQDIKLYLDFEKEMTMQKQYWEALLVLCDWELAEVRKKEGLYRAKEEQLPPHLLVEERGMYSIIQPEVKNVLEGQTYGELEALQSKIEAWMCSGAAKVVEYWEAVLKRIPIFKAKASLKDVHDEMLSQHLQRLGKPLEKEYSSNPDGKYIDHGGKDANVVPLTSILEEETKGVDDFEQKTLKAMGEMEEGDSVFGLKDEINLDSPVPSWNDQLCPRKTKFFNSVRTGYKGNKYNQTHYDHENPPPKTVQGYKFNIFYPDIIDRSKVPTYTVEKDGDSGETCILRFHAGAPYEDIAFRIVNKEWECSSKKGFKCSFERGTLQLYFNLKRYGYRR